MTKVRISYPVVNVDFSSKTLGRFMVRYFPSQERLEWPDDDGVFGAPDLSVKDFQSPNPTMLQRDLTVRIKLAEAGFSFRDICALDSMELADSPLTGAVRDSLALRQRDRFDSLIGAQDEARTENDTTDDMFRPLDEEPDERLSNMAVAMGPTACTPESASDGRPISIINYASRS